MTFVSVTRLRLRSWRFLPEFALLAYRTRRQCTRAPGFNDGSLLADRHLTFWTMTLWQDEASMRAYMTSGDHRTAMPRLLNWCDEASVVHWTQPADAMPEWSEADRQMRAQGRASKVRNPTQAHASLAFAAPRTSGAAPIRPV